MTTKKPLCKQIIIPIDNENITSFIKSFSKHVANLIINFIKVASSSDLLVVRSYIKNLSAINARDVQDTWLPLKSKITIVWIDIWDSQSRPSAKTIINKSFNIRSYIAII